jgi:anti-sigma B factor antagonist
MNLLRVKGRPTAGVVRPSGPIDFRNVDALRQAVSEGRRKGLRTMVVDLSEVRYVNSLGISALISLADELAARGGALRLAAAAPKVKVVFDLMGLQAALPLYGSVSAALRN